MSLSTSSVLNSEFSSLHLVCSPCAMAWKPSRLSWGSQKGHLVCVSSLWIALLCCLMSNVLKILVLFLQCSFLVARGRQVSLFSLLWLEVEMLVICYGVKAEKVKESRLCASEPTSINLPLGGLLVEAPGNSDSSEEEGNYILEWFLCFGTTTHWTPWCNYEAAWLRKSSWLKFFLLYS